MTSNDMKYTGNGDQTVYVRTDLCAATTDNAEALEAFERIGKHVPLYGKFEHGWQAIADLKTIRSALLRGAGEKWRPIESAPVGSNEQKESHFIGINKWGSVSRCYRIHNGSGPYAMHSPWYNNHGQEFTPIWWMPLPPINEAEGG